LLWAAGLKDNNSFKLRKAIWTY